MVPVNYVFDTVVVLLWIVYGVLFIVPPILILGGNDDGELSVWTAAGALLWLWLAGWPIYLALH